MNSKIKQGIIIVLVAFVGMPILMGLAINFGSWIQGAPTLSQHNDATRQERRLKAEEVRRQKELDRALEQVRQNLENERAIPVKILFY